MGRNSSSYELVFGHGHRVDYKDLTDEIALQALSAELIADEQIRLGDVGNPALAQAINALLQKVNAIMTDLTALHQADTDIKAAVTAAGTVLTDLAARVAAIPVAADQQPEVDGIASDLESTATALNTAAQSATAETTVPAAQPPAPVQVAADGTVVPPVEPGTVAPGEPVPTSDAQPVEPAPLEGGTVPAGPGADTTAAPDAGSVAAPEAPADTPAAPVDPATTAPAADGTGAAPQA